MANNRLYILDTLTGEVFPLCKALGNGWYVGAHHENDGRDLTRNLDEWMESDKDGNIRDLGSGLGDEPTRLRLVDENHLWGFRDITYWKPEPS